MQQEIRELKCDHCNKIVSSNTIIASGVSFQGWYHVSAYEGHHPQPQTHKDFCSNQCLLAYYSTTIQGD